MKSYLLKLIAYSQASRGVWGEGCQENGIKPSKGALLKSKTLQEKKCKTPKFV